MSEEEQEKIYYNILRNADHPLVYGRKQGLSDRQMEEGGTVFCNTGPANVGTNVKSDNLLKLANAGIKCRSARLNSTDLLTDSAVRNASLEVPYPEEASLCALDKILLTDWVLLKDYDVDSIPTPIVDEIVYAKETYDIDSFRILTTSYSRRKHPVKPADSYHLLSGSRAPEDHEKEESFYLIAEWSTSLDYDLYSLKEEVKGEVIDWLKEKCIKRLSRAQGDYDRACRLYNRTSESLANITEDNVDKLVTGAWPISLIY